MMATNEKQINANPKVKAVLEPHCGGDYDYLNFSCSRSGASIPSPRRKTSTRWSHRALYCKTERVPDAFRIVLLQTELCDYSTN